MRDAVDRLLEQWHQERPDVDVSPIGVVGRVSRAARTLERGLQKEYARHGLQSWEFDILATLRRSGAPYELTAGALASSSMVTSGAITNRIDRLVARGLVTRDVDPANRRTVRIGLTPEGRRLVDDVLPRHVANEAALLAPLSAAEQQQLAGLLRKLLAAHEQRPARD
jgi:DNA-binding MarR family transcriptional regulator